MGNAVSFIRSHGKRFINRYNAQYRALKFLEKEKLPSAPRYEIPNSFNKMQDDPTGLRDLHSKNLALNEYLKEVYVKSHDEKIQDSEAHTGDVRSSKRPLPEYREPLTGEMFPEPEEVDKGYCTLTQSSTFMADHDEDPLKNNSVAIARKYSLDIKDVENVLKYFSVFRAYNKQKDLLPQVEGLRTPDEGMQELKEISEPLVIKKITSGEKDKKGRLDSVEPESKGTSMERHQIGKKAVKNQ